MSQTEAQARAAMSHGERIWLNGPDFDSDEGPCFDCPICGESGEARIGDAGCDEDCGRRCKGHPFAMPCRECSKECEYCGEVIGKARNAWGHCFECAADTYMDEGAE